MKVSRSGFYDYLKSDHSIDPDAPIKARIREIFAFHRQSYGSRRMIRALRLEGYQIGRHKVRRLMRELGLKAKRRRRFKVTTESNHRYPVASNLLDRNFDVGAPQPRLGGGY
jgi:transposase InsO family protein